MTGADSKIDWDGEVLSVQPCIRLTRSFDQRSHSYLGYVLRIHGMVGGGAREFVVALGKGAHDKHQFRPGDHVSGVGMRILGHRLETADLYTVSKLKVIMGDQTSGAPPVVRAFAENLTLNGTSQSGELRIKKLPVPPSRSTGRSSYSLAGGCYEVQKRNLGREPEVVRVAFERQGKALVPVGVAL